MTELFKGNDRLWIIRNLLLVFFGITEIGETRSVGKRGDKKGPATLPNVTSLLIFFRAIKAISPTRSLDLNYIGNLGPEYCSLNPYWSPWIRSLANSGFGYLCKDFLTFSTLIGDLPNWYSSNNPVNKQFFLFFFF